MRAGGPCVYQVIAGGDKGEILYNDGQPCIEPFDATIAASINGGADITGGKLTIGG